MIFLLDNYDSFTYNLAQIIGRLGRKVHVARNDRIGIDEVAKLKPEAIFLSPGPGRPEDSGILLELIAAFAGKTPMFGVCLGMQAIGMHWGARVVAAQNLMHGKTCRISHDGKGIFTGINAPITAMRYHSLVLDAAGLGGQPVELSAHADDGELMAFRHQRDPIEAVQFHPESFATEHGEKMIKNFLDSHGC
ncbi:MAG: aminodeoxychorismate/anthranilate synthase component II [Betaproteobacteria bacterium]|nr:aminodeoxychorismate/anthranilate synthase component II [Betaproteobacteria bacterium]